MGFLARAIVEALSHIAKDGVGTVTCKSKSRHLSHEILQVLSAKDLYSDSVELLDTTVCFFDCQEMRLCPRKIA